jgi:nucleoside 2-deoxyribosyltransferase
MAKRRKVYIAGPMSGYEDYNYPAFFAAESRWQNQGWEVFNPARNPHPPNLAEMGRDEGRAYFMKLDLPMVLESDAVAVLPGWEDSPGARVEVAVGRILTLPILDAMTFQVLPIHEIEEVR